MNIFVGNLSFDATETDVQKLFEGFGNVASVAIVMRKEKKAPKSRGFGFVQMPDEQQALAAIAGLNGKEFMGRVLDVDPARPNPTGIGLPIQQDGLSYPDRKGPVPLKEGPNPERVDPPIHLKEGSKTEAQTESGVKEKRQPGTYKGGRRTHSYMKRRGLTGMQEETKPRRKNQDNPMRWRKRADQPRPWLKSPGEDKPWKKAEGEPKPWRKSEGGLRSRKKAKGETKRWRKPEGGIKPWKKPAAEAKLWSKSGRRPQKSRFNSSTSLGMVRGNGERSRTKGRRKPCGYKR